VPAERRAAAAAALGGLFARRRGGGVLAVALPAAALLHAALVALVPWGRVGHRAEIAAAHQSYLRRVVQTERARHVAVEMAARPTMPPPPADPERVVSDVLADQITSDVEKVVGRMLPVKVTRQLATQVMAGLDRELQKAAESIAAGGVPAEEIEALQKRFRARAHEALVDRLRDYRKKTQVKRAATTVTRWYEEAVAPTLIRNMYVEMFRLPHRHDVWSDFCDIDRGWGFVRSKRLTEKRQWLKRLSAGRWRHAGGRGRHDHPAWPGPSPEQAQLILETLKHLHSGETTPRHRHRAVSWARTFSDYVDDFFPHRREEISARHAEALRQRWQEALSAAEGYAERAADPDALDGCMKAIGRLSEALAALEADNRLLNDRGLRAVNRAVRSRALRGPRRDEAYRWLMDKLVAGLTPLIRDFAIGQFEEGIIEWDRGAERAMEEFPHKIVPLLRRDLEERLFPKKRFDVRVFDMPYANPYEDVVGRSDAPDASDVAADERAFAEAVAANPELKRYAEARAEVIARQLRRAVGRVKRELLKRVLTGGLLFRDLHRIVEGADFADRVREKLDARAMALAGRGQDLTNLRDGVPDASTPLVALKFGATKGRGAGLTAVLAGRLPAHVTDGAPPEAALRSAPPRFPPLPEKWGFRTQPEVAAPFRTRRFEAIPFLPRFPRLDGDLGDWGRVRPLVLRGPPGREILLYAAWNYQGFFFGYRVRRPLEDFYYVSGQVQRSTAFAKATGVKWAYRGDHLRLLVDTLDARPDRRGQAHTQEFAIFPLGAETEPALPGIERVIASRRDATAKEYRGVKSSAKVFGVQPPPSHGPDGSGPYRRTRLIRHEDLDRQAYEVEVFLPRSLFNEPVFCPGWYVGFDASVKYGGGVQYWASDPGRRVSPGSADTPSAWGDLLLLGTDARFAVQDADAAGTITRHVVPGHSYLLTVIDPDRNIHLTARDSVLISAEVTGARGDVEVFILEEVEDNSGVFRGYVNTQPGTGSEVHGVLEMLPARSVRFGYVDLADGRGVRNRILELSLPVISPLCRAGAGPAGD